MSTGLEFSGQERFQSPIERVFAALTDLDALAAGLPDLVSATRDGPDTVRCIVRPGFAFLRGTLNLEVRLVEQTPPERARIDVRSSGIGQSLRAESTVVLAGAEGGGTVLDWTARVVELRGLVATVSRTLIRAAAEQTIRHAWTRFRERLEASRQG
jgi:carbon monoxide dehydrogenase subunit G